MGTLDTLGIEEGASKFVGKEDEVGEVDTDGDSDAGRVGGKEIVGEKDGDEDGASVGGGLMVGSTEMVGLAVAIKLNRMQSSVSVQVHEQ